MDIAQKHEQAKQQLEQVKGALGQVQAGIRDAQRREGQLVEAMMRLESRVATLEELLPTPQEEPKAEEKPKTAETPSA